MAYVRSAGLRGVRAVIDALGGDADDLARRSGLPGGALDSDEILVQDLAIGFLLETAAVELRCPDFGLRVALRQDLGLLGPVAAAIRHAPTTTRALEMTSKYLFFHARSLEITVVPDPEADPGVLGVRFGYRDDAAALPPQAVDMVLLFLHRSMLALLGGEYGLLSVELPNPLNTVPARYRELFSAPARPLASAAMLRVPAALLGREITGGDLMAHELALSYLEQHGPARDQTYAERTRTLLLRSLDTGTSTLGDVAALLSVSPRTLQRHLTGEGTSFSGIRDEVRRDVAARLLATTEIPLYQIASALALDDVTTFSQYARRWWGVTARQFRADRRGPGAVGRPAIELS
ncbi:MAG: AraC family transcriptional regulator ligand-binding domain-containing protein [Dietzia sp.]|uniref:AraC family transcriptional regulator n=1 Tax=Dietzia TaxID=37914 RepID=UPI0015CD1805|nr:MULTISPECIES: AraC family transcriptional regulator [Dietzia]MBB1041994.1 AraC family transcriptional regulator [Dietzia sp. Cai40]MBB1043800.1 AraC family transcriptional regulator [Dietzia sp. DQ11-44]MBB1049587.1 AraC family transcriptional regulator [Dietzia sp. CW19]MBB1055730.1 AraC family transcriptional regulator [Dietzia sp. B44]MBB1057068.1 AraC family transcriptional regulator [Dietzia sp. B19]